MKCNLVDGASPLELVDVSIIHVLVVLVGRVVKSVAISECFVHLEHELLAPRKVPALPEDVAAVELLKHIFQELVVTEGRLLQGRLDGVEVVAVTLGVAVLFCRWWSIFPNKLPQVLDCGSAIG